jgi:hypothetical protein
MSSAVCLTNKDESEQPKMNKSFTKVIISIFSAYIGLGLVAFVASNEAPALAHPIVSEIRPDQIDKVDDPQTIAFKHGDISWLPTLAHQAGWPKKTWSKLGQIILRESGGCPNRIGSSIVDKNCNITGWTKATNKSDSGLLQINGVNYNRERNKNALVCLELKFCKQEQLLDPINNLKAGFLLYQKAGWDPWDPCAWGPAYAHRCKKSN